MSQFVGVSELVGVAQAGGSLKSEGFRHSVVGAVGMAAASGKATYVLGCELHRLRCAQQAERWHITVGMIEKQIGVAARRQRWRKGRHLQCQISRMAEQVLRDWLFDLCLPCVGRGHHVVDVDDAEKEVTCDACGGKGRSPEKGRHMAERMSALGVDEDDYIRVWDERFVEALVMLDKSYGVAQRSIARRLGRRVEDA